MATANVPTLRQLHSCLQTTACQLRAPRATCQLHESAELGAVTEQVDKSPLQTGSGEIANGCPHREQWIGESSRGFAPAISCQDLRFARRPVTTVVWFEMIPGRSTRLLLFQ